MLGGRQGTPSERRERRRLLRDSAVLNGVVSTLIVLSITGLVSPGKVARDAVHSIIDVIQPDPPAEVQAVESIYRRTARSSLWQFPPTMSGKSKDLLIRRWSDLRPDRLRPFPRLQADWRSLDEIFQNRSLDGRSLFLTGFVDEVGGIHRVADHPGLLIEAFRVATGDDQDVAWCGKRVFKREEAPEPDEYVEVMGTAIARGSAAASTGGFVNGTYLVCSAVRSLVPAEAAREVADLFEAEEHDSFWRRAPSMSNDARIYLLYHWSEATPYLPHAFPPDPPRSLGADKVSEDHRFDDGTVAVAGYVTQRVLTPARAGETLENFRLGVRGQETSFWCETTLQNERVLGLNEYVEAIAVPVARGTTDTEEGGFQNATFAVCPAVRRG